MNQMIKKVNNDMRENKLNVQLLLEGISDQMVYIDDILTKRVNHELLISLLNQQQHISKTENVMNYIKDMTYRCSLDTNDKNVIFQSENDKVT